MLVPIIVGILGIALTVSLHAITTSFIVEKLRKFAADSVRQFGSLARTCILGATATVLAIKHFFDIVLWAMAYRNLSGEMQFVEDRFETALYFSAVTYTTLGYGDITLSGTWRVITGIQAMNGILLFGWSTALLFLLVQKLWLPAESAKT